MSLNDKDSDCGEALEPPLSLWKMVEEHVPASERPEIKKILGEAAIDLSLELHAEVDTLLELWRELRRGTFSADQQLVPRGRPVLADPPVIKDMLKEEIRLLLLSVQQKAHSEGRDEDKAIAKYNSKVVHFVMGSSRPGSRMCRPRSVIGKHGGEDVPSRVCTASHGSDERSVLEEECQSLKRRSAFLLSCLEEEKHYSEELMVPAPSLTELKEERRVIERDLQLNPSALGFVQALKTALPRSSATSARPIDLMFRSSATERSHGGIPFTPTVSFPLEDSIKPRASPCPAGLKLKDQTFKTANTVVRGSVLSGNHGKRSKEVSPRSAKAREQEQGAARPDNPAFRTYSPVHVDSRTSPHREGFQVQASTCQSSDATSDQPPYPKMKLSDVKGASSDFSLLDPPQSVPDLRLMAQNRGAPVLIPMPPSNQQPSSSSAVSYRRVRFLQSNSAI
ncbi:coiled-coil domain-containing protein 24 isoform X2 [Rhinatrema bivittatum]|uniref:coiled-coil domain-containing protein 24 isoform X2 n=1 Tax=Rhinatrema bivittatum TaxID=194408 RepID=UPI00112CDBCC|nr:coiled-coil domain-containing protein 24 isoform X2 [Rhinatrema bivittatum]